MNQKKLQHDAEPKIRMVPDLRVEPILEFSGQHAHETPKPFLLKLLENSTEVPATIPNCAKGNCGNKRKGIPGGSFRLRGGLIGPSPSPGSARVNPNRVN